MRAFVTGGTGFIGSHLVEALIEKGFQVTCLVRKTSDLSWLSSLPLTFVEGDLSDEDVLKRSIEGQDYVFHLAGLTKAINLEAFNWVNYQGTRNLLKASLECNESIKRFVFFSSLAAVGPSKTREPIGDDADPHPISLYGESKRKAEEVIQQYNDKFPITILRPPSVYGPRERDYYRFFRCIQKGWMPYAGYEEHLLSIVYVKDLTRASLLVLETPKTIGKIYFISDDKFHSWSDIARAISTALDKHPIPVHIPLKFFSLLSLWEEGVSRIRNKPSLFNREKLRELRERYWICDPGKAKEEFGFRSFYSLDQGIKETAEWYLENGWL
jgi:nucleoside-diphosphate-sugar epimerase